MDIKKWPKSSDKMKSLITSFLFSLILAGCGFHLRGVMDVPTWLSDVAVVINDDNKQLGDLLKSQLRAYKISVTDDPVDAKYWLVINYSTVQQQIISIGASTNPRQYQLALTTEFSLLKPKGDIIKPVRRVLVTRQFTANNDRILGSNEEQATMIHEMRQDTAIQILNRLAKK